MRQVFASASGGAAGGKAALDNADTSLRRSGFDWSAHMAAAGAHVKLKEYDRAEGAAARTVKLAPATAPAACAKWQAEVAERKPLTPPSWTKSP